MTEVTLPCGEFILHSHMLVKCLLERLCATHNRDRLIISLADYQHRAPLH